MWLSPYTAGRNPKVWDKATSFIPQRFIDLDMKYVYFLPSRVTAFENLSFFTNYNELLDRIIGNLCVGIEGSGLITQKLLAPSYVN
jgi:hypothetical protein